MRGFRFPCLSCEYQATTKPILKTHHMSDHEGNKYSCKLCDYKASTKSRLRRHQQWVHEGVKHPCEFCEYWHLKREVLPNTCNQYMEE